MFETRTPAMTPPDGFELLTRPSPLIDPWRPLYVRNEPDRVALGILVREPHTNSRGTVHGGLFAALADQGMGMTCVHRLRTDGVPVANIWTSSMTVDYLGVAKPGQWLAFDTVFCRPGRTLCHAEMDITADGETVARARATFRVTLERAAST
jgi:uncharacterized protein (TIGR00369 family)